MQLQCTPARAGGTSREVWVATLSPLPQLTLSMVPLGGLPSSRLSRRQLLAFSQWLRLAWLPSCLLSMARTARKACRAARGRGFLQGGDTVTADPLLGTVVPPFSRHSHDAQSVSTRAVPTQKGWDVYDKLSPPPVPDVPSTHSELCSARGMVSTSG